jgi:hypothetical protein
VSETGIASCEFYGLQDHLHFDQPSKAAEWLIRYER